MEKLEQKIDAILKHLQEYGNITSWEAIKEYGCTRLSAVIWTLRHKYNLAILVIEHHMDLIMNISDRIYVLNFGKLLKTGTPTEIQNDKDVIGAYLGE